MPAPVSATFSLDALTDANTAFLDLLDAGAGAAVVKIRAADDTLLVTVTLTDPAGTIAAPTGQLTLTQAASGTGVAEDTAAYGDMCDSDDNIHLSLPVATGTSAQSNLLVLNSLSIYVGSNVDILSATVG